MDKIGLVTITYNSSNFLRSFLDCVWKQTHSNLILYVIDNASVDTTLSMLDNEKNTSLRVVKNVKNFGVAKAIIQVFRQAIFSCFVLFFIFYYDVYFESALFD